MKEDVLRHVISFRTMDSVRGVCIDTLHMFVKNKKTKQKKKKKKKGDSFRNIKFTIVILVANDLANPGTC